MAHRVGRYLHGRGMTLQLADGVNHAVNFVFASDFWQSNSSEEFHELGSW
jgi:hypothetical protein